MLKLKKLRDCVSTRPDRKSTITFTGSRMRKTTVIVVQQYSEVRNHVFGIFSIRKLFHIVRYKTEYRSNENNKESIHHDLSHPKSNNKMPFPTTVIQENDQDSFLVEQVALCIPCGSGMSIAGNSCDASSLASWELDGEIDTSFSSRSYISPLAKALDISERLPLQLPTVPSKKKGKKGRKQRKGRFQLSPEEMAKLPCRFFQSKKGCRMGACCPFNHATL